MHAFPKGWRDRKEREIEMEKKARAREETGRSSGGGIDPYQTTLQGVVGVVGVVGAR